MSESKKKRTIKTAAILVVAVAIVAVGLAVGTSRGCTFGKRPVFTIDFETPKNISPAKIGYAQVDEVPCPMQAPRGIAVGPDDRLHIVGDRSLVVMAGKETVRTVDLSFAPQCVAVDADGMAFVGGDGLVAGVGESPPLKPEVTLGPDALVYSLAVTDDYIFAGDPASRCVWRIRRSDLSLTKMGREDAGKRVPKLVMPSAHLDVAVDTAGGLWMVNPGVLRLQQLRDDGSLVASWGVTGAKLEAFSGCCNPAHIAVLPDGSFVTAEKGMDRVKVYDARGAFVTAVADHERFRSQGGELDLACDGKGHIYVLDPAARVVRVFVKKNAD